MVAATAPSWRRQIADRLVFMWPLKAFGTMGFMVLFFWAYFAVLRNPLTPPLVMPVTWLDTWIGFSPSAFPAYVSLWVYVSLAPALIGSLRALLITLCIRSWQTQHRRRGENRYTQQRRRRHRPNLFIA